MNPLLLVATHGALPDCIPLLILPGVRSSDRFDAHWFLDLAAFVLPGVFLCRMDAGRADLAAHDRRYAACNSQCCRKVASLLRVWRLRSAPSEVHRISERRSTGMPVAKYLMTSCACTGFRRYQSSAAPEARVRCVFRAARNLRLILHACMSRIQLRAVVSIRSCNPRRPLAVRKQAVSETVTITCRVWFRCLRRLRPVADAGVGLT